ncbi:MAG: flagellar filament capping protein FliD [Lachnospiraceae bacterium]|nr:flagellar filament capping protein FliD [Lachnospiraceae bacterium]
MPNRVTGLSSGLDTESLVTSLVSGYQKKVDNLTGNQKRLEWKQDAWKSMNSAFTKFYNGPLDTMSMKSSFMKKVTTATNPNAVKITTKDAAMNATQTMKVNKIASSAFTTGDKIEGATSGSKTLADLGLTDGGEYELKINVGKFNYNAAGEFESQDNEGTISLKFTKDSTIDEVISAIKGAKVDGSSARFNANFDANQGRIYMSAATTGNFANFTFENSVLAEKLGLLNGTYNDGSDAEIELNGVKYFDADGTFDINGLQITANEVTDKEFTITTKTDTSGIYDMVKDLLKQYNEMIKTLDTSYYADSSAKFKMLTEDEKYAMSDREVEEWEKKIKDGLLSKDSTLGEITSGLKSLMQQKFEVVLGDGSKKEMTLSDFGINTGSYLTTAKEERGVLHIDGDKDDIVSKSAEDKLQAMIDSDPDAVADFFSKLAQKLRDTMFNQMKGTTYSSSFTIYEDKLMAQQYSSYNTQIATAQERLNKKQDAYYAKFAKMETAMSKLNQVQQNMSGYFG